MTNITDVSKIYANALKQTQGAADTGTHGASFGDLLKDKLEGAMEAQYTSERVSASAVAGQADMTEVLQAMTDAEVALQTVLGVRNKLVQAYDQILRTPI